MKHSFGLDVLNCPRCDGRLQLVAVLHDGEEVRRLLEHLYLWSEAQAAASGARPARRARDLRLPLIGRARACRDAEVRPLWLHETGRAERAPRRRCSSFRAPDRPARSARSLHRDANVPLAYPQTMREGAVHADYAPLN